MVDPKKPEAEEDDGDFNERIMADMGSFVLEEEPEADAEEDKDEE